MRLYVKKQNLFQFYEVMKNTSFTFRFKKKLTDIDKGHKFDL